MRISRSACWLVVALVAGGCGKTKRGDEAATFKARADSLRLKGELDSAIAEYDRALSIDSTDGRVLNSRANAWGDKGEYDRALQDYDRALALNPNHAMARKNRSRVLFYLGRFDDAVADMEKALPSDSTNAYVVIWLHIARRRLGQDDAQAFVANLARTDSIKWPAVVGKFYLGKASKDQMLAAAALIDPRVKQDQRCAADFFLAEDAMIRHKPDEARPLFQRARDNCPKDWTEYRASAEELDRLSAATPDHK